jgi:hypothetical protein
MGHRADYEGPYSAIAPKSKEIALHCKTGQGIPAMDDPPSPCTGLCRIDPASALLTALACRPAPKP